MTENEGSGQEIIIAGTRQSFDSPSDMLPPKYVWCSARLGFAVRVSENSIGRVSKLKR